MVWSRYTASNPRFRKLVINLHKLSAGKMLGRPLQFAL
jgi:hypothetical protein